MVNIRQATVSDLFEMQNANLFCLPENYQMKYTPIPCTLATATSCTCACDGLLLIAFSVHVCSPGQVLHVSHPVVAAATVRGGGRGQRPHRRLRAGQDGGGRGGSARTHHLACRPTHAPQAGPGHQAHDGGAEGHVGRLQRSVLLAARAAEQHRSIPPLHANAGIRVRRTPAHTHTHTGSAPHVTQSCTSTPPPPQRSPAYPARLHTASRNAGGVGSGCRFHSVQDERHALPCETDFK